VVSVLVILDGASEPLGTGPTSLERACTPVLDRLAGEGVVAPLRTVPPGLPAGSETAIPGLLGWLPGAPVDRGVVEAVAHEIDVAAGERARRVDRRDRADAAETVGALAARLPRHRVHHLVGHRMLLVGPGRPPSLGAELFAWPEGLIPPRLLDESTAVIGARGAAIGVARLMGARTVVPPGATGRLGSDLAAKATAADDAIRAGAARVVVHVGAPDEAAHEHDVAAKVAAIEAADTLLLAPLADAIRGAGGTLRVCPDHGCDPETGEHDAAPVPCLTWPAERASGGRLTERAVAA
jgi:2,3-bisphosphoglycerate-independent phosphoglycerate mutase